MCLLIYARRNPTFRGRLQNIAFLMMGPIFIVLPIKGCNGLIVRNEELRNQTELNRQRDAIGRTPIGIVILENELFLTNRIAESVINSSPEKVMTGTGVHKGVDFEESRTFVLYKPTKDTGTTIHPQYVLQTDIPRNQESNTFSVYDVVYAAFSGRNCIEQANDWLMNRQFKEIVLPVADTTAGAIDSGNDDVNPDPSLKLLMLFDDRVEGIAVEMIVDSQQSKSHHRPVKFHPATASEKFLMKVARFGRL